MRVSEEVGRWRQRTLARLEAARLVRARARVVGVAGWMVRVGPMLVQAGEAAMVAGVRRGWHPALAVAAETEETRLLLLEGAGDVRPGLQAEGMGEPLAVGVGPALFGRVIDPLGRPLDGKPAPAWEVRREVFGEPPAPLDRRTVAEPLWTGLRALDGFLTCAKGQRLGILGPAGSGKTTLLQTIARRARADVAVVGLVGERGREVFEAADGLVGDGRPAVVVASGPHDPPGLRLLTAHTATAIAEHFRDEGAHVLLAVDSLTRLAHAQREIGLALGELPATRAYPPSVFGLIPQVIERAGAARKGAITGFYTVLTEAEDLADPIAEVAMASLDGQVVLSRRLANEAAYPAVDLLRSLSRLMPAVVSEGHYAAASGLRRLIQAHEDARDLLDTGLYRPGANAVLDRALRVMPRLRRFVAQGTEEVSAPRATVEALEELAGEK